MLRANLSTKPFYNERIIHLLLLLAGVIVVVLTLFNVLWIGTLSRQNTELSGVINTDRNEAQRLTGEARRIRAGINQDELKATVEAANAANRLIDQRTFSWTAFFNRIEDTLPAEVMLTNVQPSFDRARSLIDMTVLARQTEDVDEFIQKLEATGAFVGVLPTQGEETEEGLHRVLLSGEYRAVPDAPRPVPGETPPAPADTQPRDQGTGRGGAGR
jgi:Tfp pilus assembly protein PilN